MINLPMEGTSQEIGRLAGNAFGVKTPKNWIPHPQDGDTDFGIDYLIQLKSGSGQVSFSFYLQLKGTTVPKYDKEKNFISYDFKTKTLNYYHNQEPLVMVAVVDLVDESQLWTCPIYYYWLDDEWFEENTEKLSSQQTIALKIPVSNILDNKLDIYDFYASRIQEKLAISDLKSGIRKKDFSVVGVIESFTDAINSKPSIIESLEEKSDVPWFHNPSGTYASDLKRCSESLLSNNIQMAEDILRKLKRNIESLTKNELAELYYQQGTLHSIKGELEEAEQSFCDSFKVDSKERYQLGYFESRFKYESLPSSEILQEMVDSLDNSSYQKCQTKAKCLALLDRADEALDCLAEHYPDKFIGQMLICTISGKTERLDEIISSNNTQEFESEREAFIYYSICARRTLYKATGGSIAYNTVQPIEGRPSYSLELMKQAFDIARAAWKAAKNLGYPADVTMLVDASILIYGYFSKLDELTVHIDLILADRPTNKYIIQPYTRLLFNLGEFEKVIKLIESIDDTNVEDCGLIIMANYNLGKLTDVLELTQKYENQLLESESLQTRLIFCIAAEIARELLEIDIYEKYEKLVLNFKDGAALIAIRKFVSDCNTDRDKCNEYAQELYRTYLQLDKPSVIAEQLFRCLDPEEEKTAGQVIELGTLIAEDRELSNSDYCHLAQAFMTTNSWDKAKDLAEKNISKGVDSSNWKLILAAAEGQKGNVGIALNLVKDALSKNKLSKQQKIYYVNLSLSLGLGDAVIKSVKELLISTTDRNEKIQFLRVLISIYSNNERLSNELNTAVEKLGNLVDQNDCEEEGQYLLFCLTTPSYKNSEEKVIEFQNRLRRYTQTFPDSPILRTGTVDPEGNADSVIKSIQALSGISDEQIERWEKNQRAIRAGTLSL
ncbi:DUF4365 domain-containing protein [Alteromonas sp. MCA-1]|uniref:DUF4365 domain-containing protein n=1 Tax=Alteromonas sp. MCA-1 TaxID=2917731 RepID=UPI001EF9B624|nr:DUF4365 domain-containing protein [Alteromonas sp. MCA-1]MCG7813031.1 DUF4365 domain-containing protein [Alteromonas sp. MCA-1]